MRRSYQAESAARRLAAGWAAWAFNSTLFGIARTLVRLAEEKAKPNAERLREYRDASLESLKQQLFSPRRSTTSSRRLKLADSLSLLAETLRRRRPAGEEGAGRQVAARAGRASWSAARKLTDVAERKKLAEGGQGGDRRRRTTR